MPVNMKLFFIPHSLTLPLDFWSTVSFDFIWSNSLFWIASLLNYSKCILSVTRPMKNGSIFALSPPKKSTWKSTRFKHSMHSICITYSCKIVNRAIWGFIFACTNSFQPKTKRPQHFAFSNIIWQWNSNIVIYIYFTDLLLIVYKGWAKGWTGRGGWRGWELFAWDTMQWDYLLCHPCCISWCSVESR